MDGIKKYDEFLNENLNQDLTYKEKEDMISISVKTTGIKNVVLWLGKTNVKISNIPNNKNGKDCFTINYDLILSGRVNKNHITNDILEKIKKYIFFIKNDVKKYFDNNICLSDLLKKIKINV